MKLARLWQDKRVALAHRSKMGLRWVWRCLASGFVLGPIVAVVDLLEERYPRSDQRLANPKEAKVPPLLLLEAGLTLLATGLVMSILAGVLEPGRLGPGLARAAHWRWAQEENLPLSALVPLWFCHKRDMAP